MKKTMLVASSLLGLTLASPGLAANTITAAPSPVAASSGDFTVSWTGSRLQVTRAGRVLWRSTDGASFVRAGTHALQAEENRGSFIVEENIQSQCTDQAIASVGYASAGIQVSGTLSGSAACATDYTVTFNEVRPGHLQFAVQFSNPAVNYTELAYYADPDARFHGFGEQFSYLDLNGQAVPVLSQEGGVGRGHQPISGAVELGSAGSAGGPLTTYYAVPHYITSTAQSLMLEDTDYAVFDLSASNSVRVRLFDGDMTGRILAGDSMLELIERFTEYSGRMRALPEWFNQGAIVGMQGGTAKVDAVLDELDQRGTPVAGVWLQDWVGKRQTSFGSQLWWNWELDQDRYPGWDGLVDRIEGRGGRMLCYINPFLVDASPKGNVRRNLYQEAIDNDYLVKKADGSVYEVTNTDFDAGMIDLTNPYAVAWIKAVIADQLIDEGRCHGWMHDFAEALPFDAVLYSGIDAAEYHNQYPVDWARIAREAIDEAGLGEEIVFFNRAGAARTPGYSTLLWQGDQLVTWDKYDGFKTAILATMTGGFSGLAMNHADIGGYTNATLAGVGYNREQELLLRWMEFAAFTAAYRTHEGLKPEDNAQFYDNSTTYDQFDRMARVYKALAFYRRDLMDDMETRGWPLVRHPMLHYPDDNELAGLTDQIMLGSEVMMAPLVNKESYTGNWKKVYFPDAGNTTWVHMFTGYRYGNNSNAPRAPWWLRWTNPARGNYQWVYVPMGKPAAFYKQGSPIASQLEGNLRSLGVK
jgi:alpha-glucosidase